MKSLVLVECEQGAPVNGALCAVAAAQPLGPITIVAFGEAEGTALQGLTGLPNVERLLAAEPARPEALANALASVVEGDGYSHVIATAGAAARAILPRLAAMSGAMAFSDVIRIVDETTFVRPVHAGAALATVRSTDALQVFSIRASAFQPAQPDPAKSPAPVESLDVNRETGAQRVSRERPAQDDGVELVGARVVVSGGRGVGSAEGFDRLRPLAGALGAALGASRAAVDAGFAAPDSQVGQTGKSVAPELYIALGISGAVQHWAGMKDSKVIVAVNKDPEAPIFQFADYGIVGDLFEVLPQLQAALETAESPA